MTFLLQVYKPSYYITLYKKKYNIKIIEVHDNMNNIIVYFGRQAFLVLTRWKTTSQSDHIKIIVTLVVIASIVLRKSSSYPLPKRKRVDLHEYYKYIELDRYSYRKYLQFQTLSYLFQWSHLHSRLLYVGGRGVNLALWFGGCRYCIHSFLEHQDASRNPIAQLISLDGVPTSVLWSMLFHLVNSKDSMSPP